MSVLVCMSALQVSRFVASTLNEFDEDAVNAGHPAHRDVRPLPHSLVCHKCALALASHAYGLCQHLGNAFFLKLALASHAYGLCQHLGEALSQEQPADLRAGLKHAHHSLTKSFNSAANAIIAVPVKEYERSG